MSRLTELPVEILTIIGDFLPNSAIKNLRLTCRLTHHTFPLRLSRLFISANPINIAVFRAVADSEIYRHGIKDIIWDDARLIHFPDGGHPEDHEEWQYVDPDEGCPDWFIRECRSNIEDLHFRKGNRIDRSDHIARAEEAAAQPPLRICWQYYQNLLYQQGDVITFQKDFQALVYGLSRFPALQRITITPAAHGWIFAPLYETPMIRAFPRGFNYPIPRGWPNLPFELGKPEAGPWEDPSVRSLFRGFGIVTRALVEQKANISELIIDANYLDTGLNCRVFESPNREYNDFALLCRSPSLTRLDLSLLVGGQELYAPGGSNLNWPSFRSGLLKDALSDAEHLESITLRTNVDDDPITDTVGPDGRYITRPRTQLVPLSTIFPAHTWSCLRHFGLSGFLVDMNDLISFLAALPGSLQSLDLSFLHFVEGGGWWDELLDNMRDKLPWRAEYLANQQSPPRIKVTLGRPTDYVQVGHSVWLEREAMDFLYGDGRNPFCDEMIRAGIIRDSFDENFELPNNSWV